MTYHPDETKRRILEAAAELFSARGFERTAFAAIEERADVCRGSITHHFGKKSELAVVVYDNISNQLVASCGGPAERVFSDLPAGIRALQSAYSDWIVDHPNEARLLRVLDVTILESQHRLAVPLRDRLTRLLADWAEPWMKAGDMRRLSPAHLYAVVLGPAACGYGDVSSEMIDTAGWRDLIFEMAATALVQKADREQKRPVRPFGSDKQGKLF